MDTLAIILSLRLIASSENLGRVSNGYLTTPELLHSQEKYSTAMMPMFHPTEDPYMLGISRNGVSNQFHYIRSCRSVVRIPCNRKAKRVSRKQCSRWKCCWNPYAEVPCSKSHYQGLTEYHYNMERPKRVSFCHQKHSICLLLLLLLAFQTTDITKANSSDVTTIAEVTSAPLNEFSDCGVPPTKSPKRTLETPIARLLMSIIKGRILGGTPTMEGDWPWIAYMYEKPSGRVQGFFCGGALINSMWIVSAAHCITQPNSPQIYGVVLGEHSASGYSPNEQMRDVDKIIRHRQFSTASFNNDIVLLKLSEAATFTRYVRPVCLLPQNFPTDATEGTSFAGRICTAIGWGATANKSRTDILQQVNLIVLPHILCQSTTKNPSSKPYAFRPVNEKDPKFCAGGAIGEDSCDGDSGGPLLCINEDGKYYLHGLTSYGTTPCGQRNLPGIYTRAANYFDWIQENIA